MFCQGVFEKKLKFMKIFSFLTKIKAIPKEQKLMLNR